MTSSNTVKNSGNKGHRGIPERSKRSSSNLNSSQESSSSSNLIEISSQQDYSLATSTMPRTESSEVTVKGSSQRATLVSSTVDVPVFQGSSSRWTMSSKATLVSKTENVPFESSSVVVISKPSETLNGKSSRRLPNLNSSANNLPLSLNSKSAMASSVINSGTFDNGVSSHPSSSNVPAFQKAAVKSSSSSKWEKNGKILPQTGEEKEFMDVLLIVGLIMVGGVIGIEISKHRHN